jgi:integrase
MSSRRSSLSRIVQQRCLSSGGTCDKSTNCSRQYRRSSCRPQGTPLSIAPQPPQSLALSFAARQGPRAFGPRLWADDQFRFLEVDFLKQRHVRTPHIVTFEEEEKILAVAPPFIRALVVLILETGMRSHREALALMWEAIDFVNDSIRIRESKTRAGIRNVPLSARCKAELLRWREMVGPEFSPFVFPNMRTPAKPLNDIRHAWTKVLKDAGLDYFWIYNLRHTFASRLSAAGVSDLFVAQMIGHSSPSILQTYAKAIDEYRRDAVRRLEEMRAEHVPWRHASPISIN